MLELGLARLDEPLEGIGADGEDLGPPSLSSAGGGGEEEEEEDDRRGLTSVLGRLGDSLRVLHSGYLWRLSRSGSLGSIVDAADAAAHSSRAASVGPAGSARWTRRWFVLRADACMYFFKTENVSQILQETQFILFITLRAIFLQESRPLGAVLISGCAVVDPRSSSSAPSPSSPRPPDESLAPFALSWAGEKVKSL